MRKTLIDIENIKVGSDPEFFIVDRNGEAFPSTEVIDGTKDEPYNAGDGFFTVRDNVLAEGNIPPADTEEEFISNMQRLKVILNSILEIVGLKIHSNDSMKYKPRFLNHDEAMEFGCSSYKNAWQLGSFAAENMGRFNSRVAGFHIHFGFTILDDAMPKKIMNSYIAKAFDYFVVFPSRQHHNDTFREQYYGQYGNYRDTAYGNECRALGGFFTDDKYLSWVYKQAVKSVVFCSDSDNIAKLDLIKCPETKNMKEALISYDTLGIILEDQLIK